MSNNCFQVNQYYYSMFLISVMNLLVIVAACFACGAIANHNDAPVHPHENFYPFGHSQGDVQLHDADDGASREIHIPTRIVFFDGTYDSLWVS